MLSIQEITEKYANNLRSIRRAMDKSAIFHPEDASIYTGLNPLEAQSIRETLRAIPYNKLAEFLGKGTTLGDYLAANKVYDDLVFYSQETDICPLISAQVVNGWQGSDLIVTIGDDGSYVANEVVSGAISPTETIGVEKATLSPIAFNLASIIGMDLEEDTGFALTDWHVKNAAKAVGRKASSLALNVLWNAPDGVGTVNGSATGNAGATKWTGGTTADVEDAIAGNAADNWKSKTIVTSVTSWLDAIYSTIPTGTAFLEPKTGFDYNVAGQDVLLWVPESDITNASSKLLTIVFDRKNAMLTGRKRWMQLENYADPVKDLAGAVVSCRQDSVTLYKDSIYVLSET